MKLHTLVLTSLVALLGFSAMADVEQIPADSPAFDVSNHALAINDVFNLKTRDCSYKIVSMDSGLNGDFNSTVIVFAGVDGVGGAIGADGSFLVASSEFENRSNLVSARVVQNEIELTFSNYLTRKVLKVLYHFDDNSKTLIESAGIFAPKKQIHSNGKAYTECQDVREQLQKFKSGRSACVNKAGEYYYIAQ